MLHQLIQRLISQLPRDAFFCVILTFILHHCPYHTLLRNSHLNHALNVVLRILKNDIGSCVMLLQPIFYLLPPCTRPENTTYPWAADFFMRFHLSSSGPVLFSANAQLAPWCASWTCLESLKPNLRSCTGSFPSCKG